MTVIEDEVWTTPPPQDTAAEQAVLGAALLSPEALAEVAASLTPTDFYRPAHRAIFASLLALFGRGAPTDPVTVARELGPELAPCGGAPYLHQLLGSTPSPRSAAYYAALVADKATCRALLALGERLQQQATSGLPAADLLAEADALLRQASGTPRSGATSRIGDLVHELVDDMEDPTSLVGGVPTGWLDLDAELRPLSAGQLVIVGARPATGKTLVGVGMARHCAMRLHQPAGFITLEMDRREITNRILSAEASVPLTSLLRRDLDEDEWVRVAQADTRLRTADLLVDDSEHHTLHTLRAWVRRHRPAIVIVDYLQLVTTANTEARYRQNAVADLARGMKLLAKSERIPVVVLAQLNRQPEGRRDGRPNLSDLRESGALEQDADVVLLLHRPELYDPRTRPGEVDVIVAKQRNGPTFTATLTAQTAYARFVDSSRWPL